MKAVARYWKMLIALILVGAAAFLYFNKYRAEEASFRQARDQMKAINTALEAKIDEDMRYADIQEELEGALEELTASRVELYQHFPKQMKEEDQIMYVLYLETLFGTEILFPFSDPITIVELSDGAGLQGLLLTVNYETTYQGFQEMVQYLATDERITSIQEATIYYDAEEDIAQGYISLVVYLMDSEYLVYETPDIAIPETGKDNLFN